MRTKQCEEKLISNHSFTENVLSPSIRDLKKEILDHDRSRTLVLSEGHPSLSQYPLIIAKEKMWMKLWDTSLEHGMQGTMSAMSVLKLISMTVFEDRTCPADEGDYVLQENTSLCEHYIKTHTDLPADFTPDSFINIIFSIGNNSDQFHELIRLNPSVASHFPL